MPLPKKDKQIHQQTISDEVYGKLLTWIMEGVLKPGEKLVDKEIAEHMGVSRTPVREALRRLEEKNMVESSANRWTRVSHIPEKEPEMIYPIIWVLEELAILFATDNLTLDDFKEMTAANVAFQKAIDQDDPLASARADTEFHSVFIKKSQNPHLINILDDLKIRYRRLEVNFFNEMGHDKSSVREHEMIIAALKDKNKALAIEIDRLNWKKALERRTEKEETKKPVLNET